MEVLRSGSEIAGVGERRFLELVSRNPFNEIILNRLPSLGLPDCYLVAGCLFQSVWNSLSGKEPTYGINDYDVFYFDNRDTSWAAENAVIEESQTLFEDLGIDVQVRNQARVHLWYEEKFGVVCPPLQSSADGIDHFLNQSSCVGVGGNVDRRRVYAPFGFEDLFSLVVRPNRARELPQVYYDKAARWSELWPRLTVIPWDE